MEKTPNDTEIIEIPGPYVSVRKIINIKMTFHFLGKKFPSIFLLTSAGFSDFGV